jgi:hypothetical protein
MLGDRTAAEDVVQDAFLGLYRQWGGLSDTSRVQAYLRSSVLNGCRTLLRGKSRRQRIVFAEPAFLGEPAAGNCSTAFHEYSTATGKPTRTLYQKAACAIVVTGEVMWVSSSGDALIGYLNRPGTKPGQSSSAVGVITPGTFRPLSVPLASGVPLLNGVAW